MGKMAIGYGSEFHLLRYMGRHRKELDAAILKTLEIDTKIDWLDFPYYETSKEYDKEYIGIKFLESKSNYTEIQSEWENFWPNKDNAMNWDAIGEVGDTWLLVEAKAYAGELKSSTGAGAESQDKIKIAFDNLASDRGIIIKKDWFKTYYQKANRLLFLHFLHTQGIEAKMVFIYFLNGYETEKKNIKTIPEWNAAIKKQDDYLNISNNKWVKEHVINVFIDTRGRNM